MDASGSPIFVGACEEKLTLLFPFVGRLGVVGSSSIEAAPLLVAVVESCCRDG